MTPEDTYEAYAVATETGESGAHDLIAGAEGHLWTALRI